MCVCLNSKCKPGMSNAECNGVTVKHHKALMHLVLHSSHSLTAHRHTSKIIYKQVPHPCGPMRTRILASSMNTLDRAPRNKTPYRKGDTSPCQMFHPQRSYAYDNPALGLKIVTDPKKVRALTWKTSMFHMFPFQTLSKVGEGMLKSSTRITFRFGSVHGSSLQHLQNN